MHSPAIPAEKRLLDNNDLAAASCRRRKPFPATTSLVLHVEPDARRKFRRIKITLNNGLSVNVDFRQGYFAGKTFNKFTLADKERQLEDALMLGDPITDLTIEMEVNYFQLNNAEYYIPSR